MAAKLINRGADVNAEGENRNTPVHLAALKGDFRLEMNQLSTECLDT